MESSWLALAALLVVAPSPCPPSSLQFATKHVSMGAVKGMKTSIWSAAPDHRWTLTTSPDGKRLAYTLHKGASKGWLALAPLGVGRNDQAEAVVDGVEGPPYEGLDIAVFSPDSRRVAYRALSGGKTSVGIVTVGKTQAFVVVDGVEGAGFDMVSRPVFSPDGRRLAYKANRGKPLFVVVDGVEGPSYDSIGILVFSADGRLAYGARRNKTAFLVIEGAAPRPLGPDTTVGDPVFGPDGRRLAYPLREGKKERVVTDDHAGKLYDAVVLVAFSPDGQHVAYDARVGQKWHLVVDETDGPEYTEIIGQARAFEQPDRIRYFSFRGDELLRSEVQIGCAPASQP